MMEVSYTNWLTEHGIKPTSNRILVVKALAVEDHPMSLSELENHLLTVDKSSIFRCLTLFREHHLVHALEDGEGGTKYELCFSHNDRDDDLHVHFYCEQCKRVFCLSDTPIPAVDIPAGYVAHTANYMIKGLCETCARQAK